MSGNSMLTVGNRGRIVIPSDVRGRLGMTEGTSLLYVETPEGLVLMTQQQALRMIRADLSGPSLVEELLGDRRAEAEREARGRGATG